MARWFIQRPQEHSHPAEIRVAEHLRLLDDRWTVVWGYYYTDKRGADREGDFLVIGPAGGILVLEVKSSMPRWFSATGRWEGEHDNPINQLMDEWSAVVGMIKDAGLPTWVTKALCIPGEEASTDEVAVHGIKRSMLVLGNDLSNWLPTWLRLFADKVRFPVMPPDRETILGLFGASGRPQAARGFLDHTEAMFFRQLTSSFSLLDQLTENRQLLVRGGPGTGKTWHALEQAFRHAAEGMRVLFLVYNLALAAQLKRLVAMRRLDRGEVVVLGWEELFTKLAATGDSPPMSPDADAGIESIRDYYEVRLPEYVRSLMLDATTRATWPMFDALVVDEGQDHDTRWPAEVDSPEANSGWWDIYRALLREGGSARAAVFFDGAQRPPFRAAERFEGHRLGQGWSQPVHVRLQPAVRYTRPLWAFLQKHRHPAILEMLDALGRGDHLPEGPEPEIHSYSSPDEVRAMVEGIISYWRKEGLCEPEEILILHKQSDIARSPLGDCRVLASCNLREVTEEAAPGGTIRHTSVNKAKGLDSRAVIMIGLPPFAECHEDFDAYTWFMGASRARQLLAVVEARS